MFENRVLRIFEPKRDEVTGEWRKLHNEVDFCLTVHHQLGKVIQMNQLDATMIY